MKAHQLWPGKLKTGYPQHIHTSHNIRQAWRNPDTGAEGSGSGRDRSRSPVAKARRALNTIGPVLSPYLLAVLSEAGDGATPKAGLGFRV